MPTTSQILDDLVTVFEQRAKDRDEDAKVHEAAGLHELAAYDTGIAIGYRGAARKARYEMTKPA